MLLKNQFIAWGINLFPEKTQEGPNSHDVILILREASSNITTLYLQRIYLKTKIVLNQLTGDAATNTCIQDFHLKSP
jgi:hypothetical protein